ncbi:efflux RND transporter permease subunit [Klebsiella pneumoniae subsp. pneumoniae]|nr:efflux RND transporter permease subunit [Klebsiella pneumoniae subsp. pneumoniae]
MASGGTDRDSLMKLRSRCWRRPTRAAELQSVRANDLPQMPQLQVDIDSNKAVSLGLSLSDVTDTLSSAWGGTYVNDFIDRGRVKKVYIQGESDARAVPSDLGKWFVRGSDNSMTPFSAFATTHWQYGPESLVCRYNGSAAFEIQGRKRRRLPAPARRWTRWKSWPTACRRAPPGRGAAFRCRKSWPAARR